MHDCYIVRPRGKYANLAWNTYLKNDKVNIENAQRRAMRLVPGIRKFGYSNRLKILNIPTLEYKKEPGRMIEVYKIRNGINDVAATEELFSIN